MASYQLLDVREEEELYKTRLLNVEEKPFKRITKRLATLRDVVAVSCVRQEQTPPPEAKPEGKVGAEEAGAEAGAEAKTKTDVDMVDGDGGGDSAGEGAEGSSSTAALAAEIEQLREDITLDFAAFHASVARLQFLHQANGRERARYDADRGSIADTCQNVRDNMAVLRAQLEQGRATLAQRKLFDDMADRITSSRTLRPRPDQQASIAKLEDECRQLERDGDAYAETWRERRQQFSRIMDESMRLRRLIRDEKEEVERREGMDDEEGGVGGGGTGSGTGTGTGTGTGAGKAGTPAAAPAPASAADDSQSTSQPLLVPSTLEGQTPITTHGSPAPDYEGGLRPEGSISFFSRAGSRLESRAGSRAASREVTPSLGTAAVEKEENEEAEGAVEAGDDVDMVEAGETTEADATQLSATAVTPMATTAAGSPADDAGGERMDTT